MQIVRNLSWYWCVRAITIISQLLSFPIFIRIFTSDEFTLIVTYSLILLYLSFIDFGFGNIILRNAAGRVRQDKYYFLKNIIQVWIIVFILFVSAIISLNDLTEFEALGDVQINIILLMLSSMAFTLLGNLSISFLASQSRHEFINIVNGAQTILRFTTPIFLYYTIGLSVTSYFLCQILVSFASLLLMELKIRKTTKIRGLFKLEALSLVFHNFKAAISISLISITSILILGLDKLLLVKFGNPSLYLNYILAFNIASVLSNLTMPLLNVILPARNMSDTATYNKQERLLEGLFTLIAVLVICLNLDFFTPFWKFLLDDQITDEFFYFLQFFLLSQCISFFNMLYYANFLHQEKERLSLVFNMISLGVIFLLLSFLTLNEKYEYFFVANVLYASSSAIFCIFILRRKNNSNSWFLRQTAIMSLLIVVHLLVNHVDLKQ